jgi:hypothetical protein
MARRTRYVLSTSGEVRVVTGLPMQTEMEISRPSAADGCSTSARSPRRDSSTQVAAQLATSSPGLL